jgi:release factor glutamine methyltransferase
VIRRAVERLRQAGIENPRLDADVLFMSVVGVDRAHLYLMLPDPLPLASADRFLALVERRASGEPVAYITGLREFMGLDFIVDPRVLIPRPETEGLVERAIAWLSSHPGTRRVVDVGTGSGAIAISIDRLAPVTSQPLIVASDISLDALAVARVNCERIGASRVRFVRGSLLDWSRDPFDAILANLPYLRDEQRHPGISHEPDLALYADDGGFALYAQLLHQSVPLLVPGGIILCEIDPLQHEQAVNVARRAHPRANVRVEADLAGLDRYLIVESARE